MPPDAHAAPAVPPRRNESGVASQTAGHKMGRVPARLLIWQVLISGTAGAVWTAVASAHEGLAALCGGMIGVVSNGFFAARVFLRGRGDAPHMLRNFVVAQAIKLALVLAMFVFAIRYFADVFLPVIATYGLTGLVFLWALRWRD
ncbi:ATP synthase subunit I [Algiphilus sp. W345]|uniref:ATP synthase subunit I n=1 Tax=Banduia mediterranea TaxID=3075609 RepID=A0ABU2WF78_9GAMM|nr:ATP synthase subunit I [Algiphilus sp. W345]MDT0495954.1 ATP synthase subunit I [Algiphilus sp. W345]